VSRKLGRSVTPQLVDIPPVAKKLIGSFHGHPTEIGDKMSAVGVTCNVTIQTFTSVFSSEREHVSAMTTPIRANVGERFETMWNAVVDLLLIAVLDNR